MPLKTPFAVGSIYTCTEEFTDPDGCTHKPGEVVTRGGLPLATDFEELCESGHLREGAHPRLLAAMFRIRHLEHALASVPTGDDLDDVRRARARELAEARDELARCQAELGCPVG